MKLQCCPSSRAQPAPASFQLLFLVSMMRIKGNDWLWAVLKAHECTHCCGGELCVSASHRCFPLASLKGFSAPWVAVLVPFRCPPVALVGSLHAWCRRWDFFNPNLPPEDFKSTTFPQIISPLSYPMKMAEYLEILGRCWLHPQGAPLHHLCSQINTQACCICCMLWIFTCCAQELLCVQAWVVLHSRCVWCSVLASSLLLGWISQPQLCTLVFLPLKLF